MLDNVFQMWASRQPSRTADARERNWTETKLAKHSAAANAHPVPWKSALSQPTPFTVNDEPPLTQTDS